MQNYFGDLHGFSWENPKVLNKDLLWEATDNKSHLSKESIHREEKVTEEKHWEIGKHWEIRKNFNKEEVGWERGKKTHQA